MLNLLGARLGSDLLPASAENPEGFWESESIMRIDDAALDAADSWWHDWSAIDTERFATESFQAFRAKLRQALDRDFATADLFAVKDPRVSRLLPLWIDVLSAMGISTRCACISRHPIEVANSLALRNGFHPSKSYLLWLRYVLDGERYSRGLARVFTSYDGLLTDWRGEAAKIAAGLGLSLAIDDVAVAREIDGFIRADLRHHAAGFDDSADRSDVLRWVKRAYGVLVGFARDGEGVDGRAELDEIRIELDDRTRPFGQAARSEAQALFAKQRELEDACLHIVSNKARIKELTDWIDTLDGRLQAQGYQLQQQTGALAAAKEQLATQLQTIQAQDRSLQALRSEFRQQTGALEAAEEQLATQLQTIQAQDRSLQALRSELQVATGHAERLRHIEGTRGWRILQAIYYRPERMLLRLFRRPGS
jgi:hypothetical protein